MTVRFSCRCPNADYLGFEATPEAIVAAAVKANHWGSMRSSSMTTLSLTVRPARLRGPIHTIPSCRCHSSRRTRRVSAGGFGAYRAVSQSNRHRQAVGNARSDVERTADRGRRRRMERGRVQGSRHCFPRARRVYDRISSHLEGMLGSGTVSFDGRFFAFSDMHVSPKPSRQPHPPIWVGGFSDAALRRAATFAEVWQPTPTPLDVLVERQTFLRQACDRIGRLKPPETRMSFRVEFSAITGNAVQVGAKRPIGRGTAAEVAADLLHYREVAGVNAFQINFHGNRDLGQLLQSMEHFMSVVAPLVT